MDKAITTVLLTIAGVVSVLAILNAVYPAISRGSSAVVSVAGKVDDRIKTQIRIVHATGELVATNTPQWQDTDSDGDFDIFLWVKNVGSSRLVAIKESDVFFGTEGDFSRIPYVDDAGGGSPNWTYQLENDTEWKPTATLKITIHYTATCGPAPCSPAPLASDTYFVKVTSSNGVSDEHFFSL